MQGYVCSFLCEAIWTFTSSCVSGDHISCLMAMQAPPAFPARYTTEGGQKV